MNASATRDPGRFRRRLVDVLLAALVCWVVSSMLFSDFAALQHYGVSLAHSSDNVAPYVLFDDLFHRYGTLAGWMFPEAPFHVPDLVLAWSIHAFTGSLIASIATYAMVSSLLFVALARGVLAVSGHPAVAWPVWLLLWLSTCAAGVGLSPGWLSHLYSYIFLPYIHSGTLLGVLAGMVVLFGHVRRPRLRLAALLALVVVLLASDRLFALQFVLPAIAVCSVLAWRVPSAWHRQAAIGLALTLLATELLRGWLGTDFRTRSTDRTAAAESLASVLRDLHVLAVNDPFGTLLLVAAALATLWTCIARRRTDALADAPLAVGETLGERALAAFVVLAVVLPLAVCIVLGRYHSVEEWRYLQTVSLLGLPLAGWLARRMPSRWTPRATLAAPAAVAACALACATLAGSGRGVLTGYAADQERCLRDAVAAHRLRVGAATYWRAGEMTARFAQGPVIIPFSADLGPRMNTLVNLAWLGPFARDGAGLPTLDFVDEAGASAAELDAAFGPASAIVQCPRSTYRLYRPGDGALAHWFRHSDWLPAQLLASVGRVAVPAAAWATDAAFIAGDGVRAHGRFAQPRQVLASVTEVPAGALGIWIDYRLALASAPAGSVRWEAVLLDAGGLPIATLGSGSLAASDRSARFDLPLQSGQRTAATLGLALVATGDVDLDVAAIGVRVGAD